MTIRQRSSGSFYAFPAMPSLSLSKTWQKAAFYTSEKRSRLRSGRPLRTTHVAAAALVLVLFFFFAHFRTGMFATGPAPAAAAVVEPDPHPELTLRPDAPRCGGELDVLKEAGLDISARAKYVRRCIRPVFAEGDWDRHEVRNISQSLVPGPDGFGDLDLDRCVPGQHERLARCGDGETIELEVSRRYPERTYPEFVFAIATNFQRLQHFRPAFKHWMAGSGARLVATVVDPPGAGGSESTVAATSDEDLEAEERRWRDDGMLMSCIRPRNPEDTLTQVHLVMIEDALDAATDETRWIGILDDDTFFPHLEPLRSALGALDPAGEHYVGAPSEQLNAIATYGMNAFGGAGVFLSAPLARRIAPAARGCLSEKTHSGRIPEEGDTLAAECVYRHSTAKLTWLRGLWQLDIHGSPDGFFESGRDVISLHHWKKGAGWAEAPVLAMSKLASSLCGRCFLSRWRSGPDQVLSAGYSIAQYRDGTDGLDLDRMEATFKMDWDYGFSLGPFRDRPDGKTTYKIAWSEALPDGAGLRELYVHRGDRRNGEVDRVVELVWGGGK